LLFSVLLFVHNRRRDSIQFVDYAGVLFLFYLISVAASGIFWPGKKETKDANEENNNENSDNNSNNNNDNVNNGNVNNGNNAIRQVNNVPKKQNESAHRRVDTRNIRKKLHKSAGQLVKSKFNDLYNWIRGTNNE